MANSLASQLDIALAASDIALAPHAAPAHALKNAITAASIFLTLSKEAQNPQAKLNLKQRAQKLLEKAESLRRNVALHLVADSSDDMQYSLLQRIATFYRLEIAPQGLEASSVSAATDFSFVQTTEPNCAVVASLISCRSSLRVAAAKLIVYLQPDVSCCLHDTKNWTETSLIHTLTEHFSSELSPVQYMYHLLGLPGETIHLNRTGSESLWRRLLRQQAEGSLHAVLGTSGNSERGNSLRHRSHAWSILDVSLKSENRTLYIKNPWDDRKVEEISYEDALAQFETVHLTLDHRNQWTFAGAINVSSAQLCSLTLPCACYVFVVAHRDRQADQQASHSRVVIYGHPHNRGVRSLSCP